MRFTTKITKITKATREEGESEVLILTKHWHWLQALILDRNKEVRSPSLLRVLRALRGSMKTGSHQGLQTVMTDEENPGSGYRMIHEIVVSKHEIGEAELVFAV